MGTFLLTFILAYLFLVTAQFIKEKIDVFLDKFCVRPNAKAVLKRILGVNLIIILEYIIFVGMIIFMVTDLIPKLISELTELPQTLPFLSEPIKTVTNKLVEIKTFKAELGGSINQIITNQDIAVVIDILGKLKSASVVFFQIIISIILSFVFLIDRSKLQEYLLGIKRSSFKFLYKEYKIIIEKIVLSFGLIFKAQAIIAFANSMLTIMGLVIIGLIHGTSFPYLLTFGLLVFIAGFIPVLGVFLSSIPIIIIAYSTIGGYSVVAEIVLLIVFVHMVEAYYLNPKIVSRFLEIPVSLTFIVLIVSEHLFGIAGLLIGISLFYFIVGLLRDIDKVLKKKKKHVKTIDITLTKKKVTSK
ncbi:MAG: AI-2E family transporter [Candidatus Gracilibacteria bacterium]|nr:AI-2E family transporter [Candidatus Gracilibacteria bacterium]